MWQWWMGDGCTWGREWWLSGLWLLSWTTPGSLSRSPGWPGAKGREWLSKDGAHVGVDTGVRPWREMKGGGTIFSDAIQSTFIYVMSLILQLCDIFFLLDHCGNSSEMICLWSLSNKKQIKNLLGFGEILFKRNIARQRKGPVQWGEWSGHEHWKWLAHDLNKQGLNKEARKNQE